MPRRSRRQYFSDASGETSSGSPPNSIGIRRRRTTPRLKRSSTDLSRGRTPARHFARLAMNMLDEIRDLGCCRFPRPTLHHSPCRSCQPLSQLRVLEAARQLIGESGGVADREQKSCLFVSYKFAVFRDVGDHNGQPSAHRLQEDKRLSFEEARKNEYRCFSEKICFSLGRKTRNDPDVVSQSSGPRRQNTVCILACPSEQPAQPLTASQEEFRSLHERANSLSGDP